MKATLALATILAASFGNTQAVFGDETKAWMIGPAKAVSGGMVNHFEFSPNGERIFYNRVDPNWVFNPTITPTAKWFAYDCQRGVSTELMIPGLTANTSVHALSDGRSVFFMDVSNSKLQGFLDLNSGRIQTTNIKTDSLFYMGDRKTSPFLMFETGDSSFGIIEPGKQPVEYKVKLRVGFQSPYFADARYIKFASYSRDTNPMQFLDATLDRSTGEVIVREVKREVWEKFAYEETPPMFELSGEESDLRLGLPERQKTTVKQPKKSVIDRATYLCPAGFKPTLSPQSTSVAYVDNGALLLRDIKPFDRDLAEKMKIAALKAEAISKSKQVGIALILFASDMEDVLPNGENFVNKLQPYLKNRKMLDGFNYTFAGGPMDQIKDPARTELGFTMAPGGRAVVYADGHAQWVPDKP